MREVRDALAVGAWAGGADGRTGEVGSAQKAGSVGKRGGRSTQWAGSADGRRRPTQGGLADERLPLFLYAGLFGKPEPAILADRIGFRFRVLA